MKDSWHKFRKKFPKLFENKLYLISVVMLILLVIVSTVYYFVFIRGNEEEIPEEVEIVEDVEEVEEIEEEIPEPVSPFTGLPLEVDLLSRPFSIMIDNHPSARPQYGLQKASYVYEIVAEGGITRLLSIFHHEFEGNFGPLRSVRQYNAHFSRENDAIMAHCGGSKVGMQTLGKSGYDNIDEHYYTSTYYRDNTRYAPHNLFTSIESLTKTAKEINIYRDTIINPPFEFEEKQEYGKVSEVRIPFDKSNIVTYKWSEEDNGYLRLINGQKHIDAMEDEQILVKNIIVQYADYWFISSVHREYGIIGNGNGLLVNNGNAKKINWSKEDYDKATKYTYEDGTPVKLTPGNTWFHILSPANQATVVE